MNHGREGSILISLGGGVYEIERKESEELDTKDHGRDWQSG